MRDIEIVPGTLAHVHQVMDELREIDRIEISVTAPDWRVAILESWTRATYRRAFLCFGQPVGIYGVCDDPRDPDIGVPWMVATPLIEKVSREFLVKSVGEVQRMRVGYTELRNATHMDNEISIKWLSWLGFRVSDLPVGPGGVLRMFSMSGLPAEGESKCA